MSTFQTVYEFIKLPYVALSTKLRTKKWPDEHWVVIGMTIFSGLVQMVLATLISSILGVIFL